MPDFENVSVRAPYEVDVVLDGRERRVTVDDEFSFPIRSLGSSDVKIAALAKLPRLAPGSPWLEFVDVEVKLFRPYMHPYAQGLWTAERCRSEAPQMSFRDAWGAGCAHTTMLASPFRHSFVDPEQSQRLRGQKGARNARDEAGQRASRIGKTGLAFVEGTLYQETRTPGWTIFSPSERRTSACVPDLAEGPGLTLIDPRLPAREVDRVLREHEIVSRSGDIQVVDPPLLPMTVKKDAVACFAVEICQRIADWSFKDLDRHFSAHVLSTVNSVENG